MEHYYARRAQEYEAIYETDDPVRRRELDAIERAMTDALRGLSVLEVACGTGYWTERLSRVGRSVLAFDAADEVLEVARAKELGSHVDLRRADAYDLDAIPGSFDGGLAGFWLSHVPRARLDGFLEGLHRRLGGGATVFMLDNVDVPGRGGELRHVPGEMDSYKVRTLADGSEHLVLKNYHDRAELTCALHPRATGIDLCMGQCYWWVSYTIAAEAATEGLRTRAR